MDVTQTAAVAAPAVSAQASRMAVRPRHPNPTASYEVGFITTSNDYAGGRVGAEVTNPQMCHNDEQGNHCSTGNEVGVAAGTYSVWPITHVHPRSESAMTGWAEVSWRDDTRRVFSWSTEDHDWAWYSTYDLTGQGLVPFRTYYNSSYEQEMDIWWSSNWVSLDTADFGCNDHCQIFNGVAVENALGGDWPSFTGPSGDQNIDFNDGRLYQSGTWGQWGDTVDTTKEQVTNHNYYVCDYVQTKYYSFNAENLNGCD